jgi:hypothetical protein
MHSTTIRKVVGSISYEVVGFLNWSNSYSLTVALGSTQPLTERVPGMFMGIKGGLLVRKADNVIAICEPTV